MNINILFVGLKICVFNFSLFSRKTTNEYFILYFLVSNYYILKGKSKNAKQNLHLGALGEFHSIKSEHMYCQCYI